MRMVIQESNIIFVYAGQGGQFTGMAGDLYQSDPEFRRDLDRADDACYQLLGTRFLPAVVGTAGFRDVTVAHPALYAVQDALTRLLARRSVVPDCVLGMSAGEFAAAVGAGALDRREALDCLLQQTHELGRISRPGAMLAVIAAPGLFSDLPLLADHCELVLVGLRHFVVAGEIEVLEQAVVELEARAVSSWRLPVDCGFHSRLIDPARAGYLSAVSRRTCGRPRIPYLSCVVGGRLTGAFGPEHLWEAVRRPIRFVEAARSIALPGRNRYVDLGPGAMATTMLRQLGVDPADCYTLLGPQSHTADVLDQLSRA
jgi:trans-AT polyketide synthase/acyltransferase/oxidoreductase domain-containing protein